MTSSPMQHDLETQIARRMAGKVPGLSVAVVRPDGIRWTKGFGFANLAAGVPATPKTVYAWFSMTKIVTATAVMQLTERGLLGLDDPVAQHYAPFASLHPTERAERATVGHLLSHSAGLANPIPIKWVHLADQPAPDSHAFLRDLLAKHPKLQFRPGAKASYSNIGFLVLGEIIESASGRPYREYIRENILEPLDMRHTGFVHTDEMDILAATGYQRRRSAMTLLMKLMLPRGVMDGTEGEFVAFNRFYVDGAAYGGLVGSITDAARFVQAHLAGGRFDGRRILSPTSAARMRDINTPGRKYDLGLGWYRPHSARGYEPSFAEHLGGGGGFWNCMRVYPDASLGVVVMGNATSYDHETIVRALAEYWWREP